MTAPKIGDRHRECAREIRSKLDRRVRNQDGVPFRIEDVIAEHFPEDDSWVERAAEEIAQASQVKRISKAKAIEIINGCRRGDGCD